MVAHIGESSHGSANGDIGGGGSGVSEGTDAITTFKLISDFETRFGISQKTLSLLQRGMPAANVIWAFLYVGSWLLWPPLHPLMSE